MRVQKGMGNGYAGRLGVKNQDSILNALSTY